MKERRERGDEVERGRANGWRRRQGKTPPPSLSRTHRDAPHAADGHVDGDVAQLLGADGFFQVLEACLDDEMEMDGEVEGGCGVVFFS